KGRASRNTTPTMFAMVENRLAGERGAAVSPGLSCCCTGAVVWLVMVISDTGASSQSEHPLREHVQHDENRQQEIGVGELSCHIEGQQVHHHTNEDAPKHCARQAAEPADYRRGEGLQHE